MRPVSRGMGKAAAGGRMGMEAGEGGTGAHRLGVKQGNGTFLFVQVRLEFRTLGGVDKLGAVASFRWEMMEARQWLEQWKPKNTQEKLFNQGWCEQKKKEGHQRQRP